MFHSPEELCLFNACCQYILGMHQYIYIKQDQCVYFPSLRLHPHSLLLCNVLDVCQFSAVLCLTLSWLYDLQLLECVPVAFHWKLHLGVLLVYVLLKLLLGWNFVLCLLDMRSMHHLGKKRRRVFILCD